MTDPIPTERLSHIIGLIYDCAIDPGRWPVAMEAIRIELNCAMSVLGLHALPGGGMIVQQATNVSQADLDQRADYADDAIEVWGGVERFMNLPLDRPIILSTINPAAMPFGTATTNRTSLEWARPRGLQDVIGVVLARDAGAFGILAFPRHFDAGLVTGREEAIMRLLTPHLQRAATINRLLDAAAIARDAFEAAIDLLSVPILLTDDRARIVHANPAAGRMLARGDLIHVRDGRLAAISAPVTRALELAVARAATDVGTLDRKGLGIPVRQGTGPSGALHVLPLRPGAATATAGRAPGAAVAVFVAQADTPFVAPTGIVAALFGLTASESRVFHLMVAGHMVADVAIMLGVEASTVKTHLSHIYQKTGMRRRAELQQMAAALILPLA